jgi:xanthine dehydrogenase YagR molybdenum-binding subunit
MSDFTLDIEKEDIDRVDGKLKVTGKAKYSAEHDVANLCYGVLVGSSATSGKIKSIDTKAALNAPGVIAVIHHENTPKVPGYEAASQTGANPAKGPTLGRPLRVFHDTTIYFNGQPIALVIADTFERAIHAATLVKATYEQDQFATSLIKNISKAVHASNKGRAEYLRGNGAAYKDDSEVKIAQEYIIPREVHNPMELHSIIASWDADDKISVYTKTQGVKSTQKSIMDAFKLPEANVKVQAQFVGGGFGSALRTWPHEIAAVIGAKAVKRPLKLVLTREQMFLMVGYRPACVQRVVLSSTSDGKLNAIRHEAVAETSVYEEFTEGIVNISRFLYACQNVSTDYKILPLNLSTPTWMRGPGEASGCFALESAMDELAYQLKLDPLELRLRNYADIDPERNLPYSSKFLKECYAIGAEKIGWKRRQMEPRSLKEGKWLVGYGMSTGAFGAFRGKSTINAKLTADGVLIIEAGVSDSGPGTATAMTQLASDNTGLSASKIIFTLGDSSLPPGPTQGGSTTTSTLGSAVVEMTKAIKNKLHELVKANVASFAATEIADVEFVNGEIILSKNKAERISFVDVVKKYGNGEIALTQSSQPSGEAQKYAMYSFSVHFAKVHVHSLTGVVRVKDVVTVADAGKIVSPKIAESQMIGGVTGGIGMALMEESVVDHRYGRHVNNNLADYHVPVNADVPEIQVHFINKPDPIINPQGSKGLGEIALIGFAAAVTNAVFNATGTRIRELPVTPDKLI